MKRLQVVARKMLVEEPSQFLQYQFLKSQERIMNSNSLLFLRFYVSTREEKLEELTVNFLSQREKWKLGINLLSA